MNYEESLTTFQTGLSQEIATLQEQVKIIDMAQQDFLHFTEFGEYTETESITIMRNLKGLREKRRTLKDKIESLCYIRKHLQQAEKPNCGFPPKRYSYRVLQPRSIKAEALEWKI
ncbi:hypothetical protein SDC9_74039 [bioreactor metagenome]|uniref:Uncharacterized protein n=1 Tax=bioreactor metagenome TaxID=1076179 RepID=A0A644YGW9_9ZZZZ